MTRQEEISNELKNLDSSLPANIATPYTVPEGYFEGLAASVLSKIKSSDQSISQDLNELSPLVAGISKKMPYSVPENYFQENINNIPILVQDDVSSPVLDLIGKNMPYEVPTGYFAGLENEVMEKIPREQAKVIALPRRNWVRMAVAAAVTGIIAFAGINYLNSDDSDNIATVQTHQTNNQTAALSKKDTKAVAKDLKKVSATELEAFIDNVEISRKPETVSANGTATTELKKALKNVSVGEMESFLQEMPTADEELLITD